MAVIKANVQDNFVVITNEVAQSDRLSLGAKGLILIMASRPPGWKFNKSQLMQNAGIGRDKLNSLFKELINNGFLAVTQNHDETGRFTDNDYYFFSDPHQNPAFIESEPFTDLPYTAEPLTEKPCDGESAPIKKESLEKKEDRKDQRADPEFINKAFDFFWDHYGRKTGKEAAIKAFYKIMKPKTKIQVKELTEHIIHRRIELLDKWKQDPDNMPGFNVLHASTFLNNKRWEDEL